MPRLLKLAVVGLSLAFAALMVTSSPANAGTYDPGPVTNISAQSGPGSLTISWTAANPGGFPGTSISGYSVKATKAGYTGTVASCSTRQETTCKITGLENGVDHWIQITANTTWGSSNVWGAGPWKACCDLPKAPANVSASAGDGTARVVWVSSSNIEAAGGSVSYKVLSSPVQVTCDTTGLYCDFTGLTNGVTYQFSVVPSSKYGAGTAGISNAVIPVGLPSAPQNVQLFLGAKGTADVKWDGPISTGGAPIVEYVAVASPGGQTCTIDGEYTCKLSGLSNGTTYTVKVKGRNQAGWSPESVPSSGAKPLAGPGVPVSLQSSGDQSSITVKWKAPKSTGGSPIQKYLVALSPGGQKRTVTNLKDLSFKFGGLNDGTVYTVSIAAQNAKGIGLPASKQQATSAKPTQVLG